MVLKRALGISFEAVLYPFKNIASLILPYIITLILFSLLGVLFFELNGKAFEAGMMGDLENFFLNALIILAMLVVVMPMFVSVTRNIVLGEKVDFKILMRLYNKRELTTLVGWLKLFVLYFLPIALFGWLAMIIFGEHFGDEVFTIGSLVVAKGFFMVGFGVLLGLIFLFKGSMAVVTGALDKGISVRNSFKIIKGHGGLLFLTVLIVLILMGLLMWLIFYLAGLFGVVWDVKALLAMSLLGKLMLITEIVAARLLMGIIFMAALSKYYLAIASKG
jgi:hypothetical protein